VGGLRAKEGESRRAAVVAEETALAMRTFSADTTEPGARTRSRIQAGELG
jgi:hypothetical protein